MSRRNLKNYVRSHRRRLGLSQDELAYLILTSSGSKVSKYENFRSVPTLETALACEIIFGKPVSELFAGIFDRMESRVGERMKLLARKLNCRDTIRPSEIRRNERLTLILENHPSYGKHHD